MPRPSGRARGRGKFVRTPEYAAEDVAGEVLYRGAFGTARKGGPLANALDIRSKKLLLKTSSPGLKRMPPCR